jgi:hypothetical protein
MHALRNGLVRARRHPARLALSGLALLLAWLILRPPFCPLIGHAAALRTLGREREALRSGLQVQAAENARLREQFLAERHEDPFLMERMARAAGFLRKREFDYAAVGEALNRRTPLPPRALPATIRQ